MCNFSLWIICWWILNTVNFNWSRSRISFMMQPGRKISVRIAVICAELGRIVCQCYYGNIKFQKKDVNHYTRLKCAKIYSCVFHQTCTLNDNITLLKGEWFSMSNKECVPVSALVSCNEGSTVHWVNADWSDKALNISRTGCTDTWTLADFGF